MTDAFAILLSCIVLAIVVLRAIRLDARLPWFEPLGGRKSAGDQAAPAPHRGILSDSPPRSRRPRGSFD
jgi:hypothetical protein